MESEEYKVVVSSKEYILWILYGLTFVVFILFILSLHNPFGIFISVFAELLLISLILHMKVKSLSKQEIILKKENDKIIFLCCNKEKILKSKTLNIEILSRIPFYKIKVIDNLKAILDSNDMLFTKKEFLNLIKILSYLGLVNKHVELQKLEKDINFSYKPESKMFIFKGNIYNTEEIKDIKIKNIQKYTNGMYMHTEWFLKITLKNGEVLKTELFENEVEQALKLEKDYYKVDEEYILLSTKPQIGIPVDIFLFLTGLLLLFIASKLPYSPRQIVAMLGLIIAFFGGLRTILYLFNTLLLLVSYKRLKKKLQD